MSRSFACVLMLLLVLVGCGASRTEIIVVVDSNLAVPSQLDQIDITVDGVVNGPTTATATLSGAGAVMLPATLGVVRTDGPLGPLTVTAIGHRRGANVVSRRAVTSFVEGHTVVLHLDLLLACIGRTCPMGETCGESGCASETIPASSLPEWMGDAGSGTDAGPADGGGVDAGPTDGGGVDMGPRDLGGVDMGPRDLGGVDMGPRDLGVDMGGAMDAGASCDAVYGGATGYMLCDMTATSCTMAVNTGGTCNAFCSGFGQTCLGAMGNVAPDCTSSGTETCGTTRTTEICVCSR